MAKYEPQNIITIGKDIVIKDGDYNALYIGGFDDLPPQRVELTDEEVAFLARIIGRLRPLK